MWFVLDLDHSVLHALECLGHMAISQDDLAMDHAKITWRQRGADTP
jgi:hypothetical protein